MSRSPLALHKESTSVGVAIAAQSFRNRLVLAVGTVERKKLLTIFDQNVTQLNGGVGSADELGQEETVMKFVLEMEAS